MGGLHHPIQVSSNQLGRPASVLGTSITSLMPSPHDDALCHGGDRIAFNLDANEESGFVYWDNVVNAVRRAGTQ